MGEEVIYTPRELGLDTCGCPTCGGLGFIVAPAPMVRVAGGVAQLHPRTVVCWSCQGKGRVRFVPIEDDA